MKASGTAVPLGLPDQDSAGIKQVEAPPPRILLRPGSWLRGDDRDVAAGRRGVREPGQQCGLDAPAAVRRAVAALVSRAMPSVMRMLPLDLLEGGGARHAVKAKPRDLVERRAHFREARHAAGDRDHKAGA